MAGPFTPVWVADAACGPFEIVASGGGRKLGAAARGDLRRVSAGLVAGAGVNGGSKQMFGNLQHLHAPSA